MPEDANNNQPQQPEPPVGPLEPWSMEADADRLISDLFQDIDRVLDGGTSLPQEPVQPEYLYLQPMDMQSIGLKVAPPAPQEPPATQTDDLPEVSSALTAPVETSEEIERVTESTEIASPIPPSDGTSKISDESIAAKPVGDRSVKKLLLLLVSTCLGVPLLLWLGRQSRGQWQWQSLLASGGGAGPSREEIQARIEADADARFASYMQQTLASIDRNARQRLATLSEPPDEANSFSGEPVRDRQLPVPNRVPTVLERVYIPVYQPPRPASPSSPLPLPPPALSDLALLPPPPPVSSDLALPPPPPSRVAPSPISSPAPPPVASNATQTLVGILELGDRSAALFDIDGVTHRFRVGDDIGDSGWTLVEISQQEAIVRRNGQLRSIYVGQKL